MDEQKTVRESFPQQESTDASSNAGNAGEGEPRTGEGGTGEGATQEDVAGQGTGQISGPDGDRKTSK